MGMEVVVNAVMMDGPHPCQGLDVGWVLYELGCKELD